MAIKSTACHTSCVVLVTVLSTAVYAADLPVVDTATDVVDQTPVPLGSPVILIPGLGGSQLQARLNRSTTLLTICAKHSDWFTIWVSVTELVWPVIECFADNLRLIYDSEKGVTRDNEGVEIRVPGFGDTKTIEYLDWLGSPLSSYFAPLAKKLVATGAYVRGQNLHGAPYDFRKGPSEMSDYFNNLTDLVEMTYAANENKPVTIVAHSMGCPLTLLWLKNRSSRWKRKYIKWFVPIAGVWAGSLKSLRLIVSGDNINLFTVNPLHMRPLQRSSPSSLFLLPYAKVWNESEVLIESPTKNYTVMDYKQLFEDINHTYGIEMWEKEIKDYDGTQAPNVPVFAIYGNGVPTPARFSYASNGQQWTEKQPTVIYEPNGDGTVNERSLRLIEKWKQDNITIVELKGVEHLGILNDPRVINTVVELVQK